MRRVGFELARAKQGSSEQIGCVGSKLGLGRHGGSSGSVKSIIHGMTGNHFTRVCRFNAFFLSQC